VKKMLEKIGFKILLTVMLLIPAMMQSTIIAYAETPEKTMVGTLSAQLDSQKGTVTVMFVGYSKGEPVIIGPSTWETTEADFSKVKPEDITQKLCGQDHNLKKVTKFSNTGKEMVAEIVIESQRPPVIVGR
jgi:hypothetical protein